MIVKIFLILSLAVLSVSALSVSTHDWDHLSYPVAQYDLEDVCYNVGRISGCSGCTLGTKGLCSWFKTQEGEGPEVSFTCLPTAQAQENELLGQGQRVDYLCPANPAKEPMIKDPIALHDIPTSQMVKDAIKFPNPTLPSAAFFKPVGQFTSTALSSARTITRESAATIFSKTYYAELFKTANNSATVTVDRTSLFGEIGFARISGWGEVARHKLDCASLAQEDLFDVEKLSEDTDDITSEKVRFCLKQHLDIYYNTYCTPYGVAKSGICHSTFVKFLNNCGALDQQALRAVMDNDGPTLTPLHSFLIDIVEDGTPFCISDSFLTASSRAHHLAGLDKPLKTEQLP